MGCPDLETVEVTKCKHGSLTVLTNNSAREQSKLSCLVAYLARYLLLRTYTHIVLNSELLIMEFDFPFVPYLRVVCEVNVLKCGLCKGEVKEQSKITDDGKCSNCKAKLAIVK